MIISTPPESGNAMAVAAVGNMVTGVSDSVLNWVDAFCVTDRCKNAKKNSENQKDIAEMGLKAKQYEALAAVQNAKSSAASTRTTLILGAGALGLLAVYLFARK